MDLSVVIVNWNGREYIRDCLESLGVAARGIETETIVVDNASTDASVDLIRGRFPHVRVLEAGRNLGFGCGLQLGIEQSRGEFIALVNPDVTLESGALTHLVSFLRAHPAAGWVGPRIALPDGTVQSGGFRLVSPFEPLRWIPGLARITKPAARYQHARPERCERLSGACMVFRSSMLASIGGMPTSTFMYGEEQLLGARFRTYGFEVWYVPAVSVLHRHRASSSTKWTPDQTLIAARVGHLTAVRETLGYPRFLIYNSLFCLGALLQLLVGLAGRGTHPRAAARLAKASLAAFVRTPPPIRS